MRKEQSGIMLLEALIGIVIFSMGVLAIIGLQAASIKASGDAQYRSQASLLANQLIGQMWASNRTPATLVSNFQSGADGAGPANYKAWLDQVSKALPVTNANPATVTVVSNAANTSSVVTIIIYWKAPNDAVTHSYTAVAQIV